ncbi:syndetin-like isoform X2 [Oscarella lobularis]|uniref:syndetin-like isoform X2 n=1 Tax=Oscarella lobularis TaxID=121494 RepID=UPI0033140EFB
MAFKSKFKNLFRSSRGGGTAAEEAQTSAETMTIPEIKEDRRENPMVIEEILESIDREYYNDPSFDATDYTLQTIPHEVSVASIDEMRIKLRLQHQAVSKKLADLVLANHEAFVEELRRVTEIENVLQSAKGICITGRRHLASAKQGVAVGGISILAKHRKRQKVLAVLESLKTIKTLQKTDVKLREILEEENYPAAVQLCLECQQAASTFKEYTCVSELSSTLQDTQDQIEERLDKALEKTCFGFDMHHYENVQTAYRLLGKTQMAMDQLHMHFTQAIYSVSRRVVLQYAEKSAGQVTDGLQRTPYIDLCKKLHSAHFLPGLTDLCKALWEIMRSYYHVLRWHERFDEASASTEKLDEADDDWTEADTPLSLPKETSFNRLYIKKKLEHGVRRVWQDVQQRVKPYLLGTDLSQFHIDNFLQVLHKLDRLMSIGEELSGSESKDLHDCIRMQSSNYFKNYHRARLGELRMFLENEGWEACPVRASFSIFQLHEFRFLRPAFDNRPNLAETSFGSTMTSATGVDGGSDAGWFGRFSLHGNPFDETSVEDEEEIMTEEMEKDADDDDDVAEELKQDFVDEETGEAPRRPSSYKVKAPVRQANEVSGPILTNSTLMIVRFFGKYMQMMNLLKPIAFDVMQSMSQLFDFYLYTIYAFFASDRNDGNHFGLSPKMTATLERISSNLISPYHEGSPTSPVSPDNIKVYEPRVSPMVQLQSPLNLFGLTERQVGVESLVYLASQFDLLRPHLESLTPQSKRAFLTQFYSQTVSIAIEIRKPVYRGIADRVLVLDKVLPKMHQVKWDIKEIMSQHSPYVDLLLEEFSSFKERLRIAEQRLPLPPEGREMMWTHCIRLANRAFVEGFAGVKKCSNEGRALMQLDFQQFLVKLEQLTNIRPIPDKQYVETYIKAYYLTEADLEQWLRTHKEYSNKHLTSLVNSGMGGHLGRKSKQRLLSLIEEIDKSRR